MTRWRVGGGYRLFLCGALCGCSWILGADDLEYTRTDGGNGGAGRSNGGTGGAGRSNGGEAGVAGRSNGGEAGVAGRSNGGEAGVAGDAGGGTAGNSDGGRAGTAGSGGRPMGGAGSGGDGGRLVETCEGTKGPTPVNVEGKFCIDSTEVTKSQYLAFLAHPDSALVEQPPECGWNELGAGGGPAVGDFEPPEFWPPSPADYQKPVASVDWCDAWSYCRWAGKRLCGAVPGRQLYFDYFGTTDSELFYACSRNDERDYPYGDIYDSNACATEHDKVDVGSLPGCEGGYDGIFDLSGNVAEWQRGCRSNSPSSDGSIDDCRLGAWDAWAPNTDDRRWGCAGDLSAGRDDVSTRYGIRCCSDAVAPEPAVLNGQ